MQRLLPLAFFLLAVGCEPSAPEPGAYVARVGEAVLTESDLTAALAAAPAGVDSMTARQQVIEQWVTAELMAHEAEERGLRDRPDVQRQLAENERAVLAAALLSTLYEEDTAALSRSEMEDYFERNRDRLRLREPYVRVRFIATTTADSAAAARRAMQQAMLGAQQDSLWEATARAYTADTAASLGLGREYVPESRLLTADEASIWQVLPQLSPGQISSVQEVGDTYYVVQLVDRAPAGEEPELAWVEDEIRRQVEIQQRKQMVARHVQRLRNEAQARDELVINTPEASDGEAP
jgi:parvulin-like peptidyl-prolyl isomerase